MTSLSRYKLCQLSFYQENSFDFIFIFDEIFKEKLNNPHSSYKILL